MSSDASAPILVVEADRDLGQAVAEQLLADGFSVELASTAEHARVLARASAPRLAVLGRLESPSGTLELLREIRQAARETPWQRTLPAIVVGSSARELDMLRAFEAGADDFLGRPATYLELRARLRAVLRRSGCGPGLERLIEVGELAIDARSRSVTLGDRPVELRRMEFELLVHLAREPERVFAKAELLRTVWRYRSGGSTRTVDSHASRLRRKLNTDGERRWVLSVWGVGYRLL
ncbi:MAG TPA: response regulator transcription factor [Solirubrobacteraceae bacterium]|nr:response regulator transcription factor [Solirubrobacteraceae bacterium]